MKKLKTKDIISLVLIVSLLVGIVVFTIVVLIGNGCTPKTINVNVIQNQTDVKLGEPVTLYADVTGIEGDYTLEWQYKYTNQWQTIEGADQMVYTFVADELTKDRLYRVVVHLK